MKPKIVYNLPLFLAWCWEERASLPAMSQEAQAWPAPALMP